MGAEGYSSRLHRAYLSLRDSYARPLVLVGRTSSQWELVASDVRRWMETYGSGDPSSNDPEVACTVLLGSVPEFRTLFYYRLGQDRNPRVSGAAEVLKRLWKPMPTLYLDSPTIGPGCVIFHGFSTIVSADAIGSDFSVSQQVTVGYTELGRPTIGDRVLIAAGAIIIGPVHIGDDATIGAGAVVVDDVPAGTTAVGVPARCH